MKNVEEQKILGKIIDKKLTLESHVKNSIKNVSLKIRSLAKL